MSAAHNICGVRFGDAREPLGMASRGVTVFYEQQ